MNKRLFVCAALSCAVFVGGCGGGGDGGGAPPAGNALPEVRTSEFGDRLTLNFPIGIISEKLPAATAFSVKVDGADVGVTGITASGSSVILTLATRIAEGQAIKLSYAAPAKDDTLSNLAVQNTSGVDASGFADLTVSNTVTTPTVKLNGAAATVNAAGEYSVSGSVRVTVDHVRSGGGLLGTNSTSTVDSSGAKASTNPGLSIHSINASRYDVTFSNGPAGGLTTIRFGDEAAPLMLVKLRWSAP